MVFGVQSQATQAMRQKSISPATNSQVRFSGGTKKVDKTEKSEEVESVDTVEKTQPEDKAPETQPQPTAKEEPKSFWSRLVERGIQLLQTIQRVIQTFLTKLNEHLQKMDQEQPVSTEKTTKAKSSGSSSTKEKTAPKKDTSSEKETGKQGETSEDQEKDPYGPVLELICQAVAAVLKSGSGNSEDVSSEKVVSK